MYHTYFSVYLVNITRSGCGGKGGGGAAGNGRT